MKDRTSTPFRRAIWLLLLLPLLLTACAGARAPSTSWPGLAVQDGVAYVAFNQAIYAVDVENGREQWRYLPGEDQATSFFAQPAVDSDAGIVYAGSFDGDVVALEQDTGNVIWNHRLTGARIIGGPALAGDLLLVPSANRQLYALRTDSGQEVWTFRSERAFWSTPRVEGEFVYLAGLDHVLYKLALEDGSIVWERDLSGALADEPASFNGLLLVGTFGEQLNAVDKETSEVAWSVETGDWVWGNPVVFEDTAFFGDVSGRFYAVNRQGTPIWEFNVEGQVAASPAAADGFVYLVTEDGSIYARAAEDSTPEWEQNLEGRLLTDPVVIEETLLVAAIDGDNLLTAFDINSGAIRWTYQPVEE
ncbi:MAG: PQQ-binding-like beta-propeller repeat protein [Anaerolineales bacterium]